MFLVNSRYRHFSAASVSSDRKYPHLIEAHLLPKLRCYFAEFLNQGSLKRLRIFSLPTCVGLRYDHPIISLEAFLDSMGSISSCRFHGSLITSRRLNKGADLPAPSAYRLEPPSNRWMTYPAASPHHSNDDPVVQEY
jgi:hypothetical protein